MAQGSLTVAPPSDGELNTSYQFRGGIQITQNAGMTVEGGGVACALSTNVPPYTTANSFLRVFDLSAEGLAEAITVQSIDMGIFEVMLDSASFDAVDTQVVLYRLAPGTVYQTGFPRTALTEIGRTTYSATSVERPGGVFNVDLAGQGISFQPDDLMVVEWAVPDGRALNEDETEFIDPFIVRYGHNTEGAIGITYLSTNFEAPESTFCGGLPPTAMGTGPLANPDFVNLQWVVVVNASLGVATEGGAPGYTIRLGDAQPNPSVSGARIPFTLETASAARVAVYDVLGREVAVLADGEFVAGDHEARLAPGTLAPGTYVVRLATPSGMVSETITVTR